MAELPPMQYRMLGRTGLRVSLLGLGTGGPSLFGQSTGVNQDDATRLVRRALDIGVNFIDSSPQYENSEGRLGEALDGVPRDRYVLATKFVYEREGVLADPAEVVRSVEGSLRRLRTDCIDLMQFHGLKPPHYETAIDRLMPTVLRLRDAGKFRYVGITENYREDSAHQTLTKAVIDHRVEAVMVAYNLLGPSADQALLPACRKREVGVIGMVAVRRSLSRPELLRQRLADAIAKGVVDGELLPDRVNPLGWLLQGEVESLPAAGYKFAAGHPVVATVLTGTASISHLEANAVAILGPPLPIEHMDRLRRIFGSVREPLGQ